MDKRPSEELAPQMPTVQFGSLTVSRLIIGGNPFSGHSHQTAELSKAMIDYYTTERIKATLREAEALGINAFVGRGDAHIRRVLNEYYNEGGQIQWIAQTAPEMASVEGNIKRIASSGAKACYLHGGMADIMMREGRSEEFRPWLELIKELGMMAGLCSHNAAYPLAYEEQELGAEFYMCCFYDVYTRGEVYVPEDREAMAQTIRAVDKPCLAFKIMAAGRNDPREAFEYAFSHIKPGDAVVVGMYTEHQPDQIEQNVRLTIEYGS
ncbi:MAG: hypothetical protein J7M26_01305 [Armatimonadetes bacterium]|nr:hypothetical protein [Armatimonadota bacterium]